MSKSFGSLIGLEIMASYNGMLVRGIVFQETYNMVKVKLDGKFILLPKRKITLILNASKVKGLHLMGLAWTRLKKR
ncbi:MAG: hypothetical protein QW514_05670 [Thermoprotei archaeon]